MAQVKGKFSTGAFRVLNAFLFFLSGFWPRDPKKVIFGAWLGKKVADNPKYLLDYLATHTAQLDLVWIGPYSKRTPASSKLPARCVRHGSLAALYEALTSKVCFITHSTYDVAALNVLRGAKVVYLGHGLALKHMGTPDVSVSSKVRSSMRNLIRKSEWYTYLVSCSESHTQKLIHEYAINGASKDRILSTGQPRVDFLIHNKNTLRASEIRAELMSVYALPRAKKIITYMPTFRDKQDRSFSFLVLEGAERQGFEHLLKSYDAVLIEKSHCADKSVPTGGKGTNPEGVFGFTGRDAVDTQELLLCTDILITDYSGCYLDYLALDRPIIHFAYDREYYTRKDRGLYYDLDQAAGGPVVEDFGQLRVELEQDLITPSRHHQQRETTRAELMAFETGDACGRISQLVFGVPASETRG